MSDKKDKFGEYLEAGTGIFNKCKTFVSQKGGDIVSRIAENMEEKAKAQSQGDGRDWATAKSTENQTAQEAQQKASAQVYSGSIKPGESGIKKVEMTREYIEDNARGQSVSSLVCGILGLWFSPLAAIWFLSFIPILLGVVGISNGKKAAKTLPPEQTMVARSGYAISIFALVISIILFVISLFSTLGSYYMIRSILQGY